MSEDIQEGAYPTEEETVNSTLLTPNQLVKSGGLDEGSKSVPSRALGQLLMMAAMSGVGLEAMIKDPNPNPTVKLDLNQLRSTEKISPSKYFFSTGPGEIEGRYYACIMVPKDVPEGEDVEYTVVGKCNYGFDTPQEALDDAAKQFPAMPILSGPSEYTYPHFDSAPSLQAIRKAEAKRLARGERVAANIEKSKRGPIPPRPVRPVAICRDCGCTFYPVSPDHQWCDHCATLETE